MSDTTGDTYGLGLVLYSGTRDELQAKLRARDDEITRLRSLTKWRDISTAPKDGTPILAVDRNGWREMWWVTNGTDYADYWQDHYDSEPEPTHWAPLPLPPPPEKENT